MVCLDAERIERALDITEDEIGSGQLALHLCGQWRKPRAQVFGFGFVQTSCAFPQHWITLPELIASQALWSYPWLITASPVHPILAGAILPKASSSSPEHVFTAV